MGAMYEKGQTKKYSRVASFKGGGSGDSKRRRISKLAKEGDIDTATDLLMKMRDAEARGSSKSAKRDEVRKIRDAVLGGGMPPMGMPPVGMAPPMPMPPPMNPMVPGMRGMPMMKKGGKVKESKSMMKKEVAFMKKKGAPKSMVKHEEAEMEGKKTKKYLVGGMPTGSRKPPMGRPGRPGQPKTKQMPRPTPSRPTSPRGAEKMKKMPRPSRSLRDSPAIKNVAESMEKARAKAKRMPAPRSAPAKSLPPMATRRGVPSRPSPMILKKVSEARAKANRMPRPASKPSVPPVARKRGMAAGGDIYTTPGGPARGKSGKIKKMAAGGMAGMIPKEGKKSPSSMGTSYKKGGAIDGCAVKGKTRGRIK